MANPSAEELYTVVENTSGSERQIGFLGARGMRLEDAETVLVPGDLLARLGNDAQRGRRRQFDSLQTALKAGTLRINSRPAPILWDPTNETPSSIAIVGGTLGVVDPTYNSDSASSSSSSSASPGTSTSSSESANSSESASSSSSSSSSSA